MVFAWDLSKATLVGPHSAYQISLSVRRSVKLRELDLETRVIIEDLCFSAREVDPLVCQSYIRNIRTARAFELPSASQLGVVRDRLLPISLSALRKVMMPIYRRSASVLPT